MKLELVENTVRSLRDQGWDVSLDKALVRADSKDGYGFVARSADKGRLLYAFSLEQITLLCTKGEVASL